MREPLVSKRKSLTTKLRALCDSTKWSITGVNQSGFVRDAFSSRYKITSQKVIKFFFFFFFFLQREKSYKVILQRQDPSKYPRFGSFKIAPVFQTAVGFTEITTNQRRISTSTLDCSSLQIYLIFLSHRCQIQEIMAGNGIVLTHCMKLLPLHSFQLRQQ